MSTTEVMFSTLGVSQTSFQCIYCYFEHFVYWGCSSKFLLKVRDFLFKLSDVNIFMDKCGAKRYM